MRRQGAPIPFFAGYSAKRVVRPRDQMTEGIAGGAPFAQGAGQVRPPAARGARI